MSERDLVATCGQALDAYKKLLPSGAESESWQRLLPLDVICVARDDQSFSEFKANWKIFLDLLDQIWNQANAFARHHISEEVLRESVLGFLGNINQQRTTDELLVYIDKARNSAHHTLWRYLRPSTDREVVTDAKGVSINVSSNLITLRAQSGGTVSEIVVLNEGAVLLTDVQVVERKAKKIFLLPESHNGNSLYPLDRVLPQMLGKMALQFYLGVVDSLRARLT
jgi:hypothetical protein